MDRGIESALLHGHPLVSDDDRKLSELTRAYPAWSISRDEDHRGYVAVHRDEPPNPRRERAGIKTTVRGLTVEALGEALFVQRALRGDGAEPTR